VHLDALVTRAERPARAAFWAGWAMGFGYFLAGLYWVASAFLTRGGGYGHILSGFPWNLPGYIWEAGGALSQNASYMGIYGLSFVTLLFALSFGPAAGGYSRTIDTYLDLSLNPSNANLSHVIWSEGAIPGLVLEDAGLMQAIDRIFAGGPDLYMGATRRVADPDAQDGYRYYNSMAAMRSTGTGNPQVLGYYNKSKLVPFGEYFPGNSLISGLNIPSLSAATASFDKGIAETSTFPGLPPVSVQICYESIFSGFTPAEPKPEWILNISNDSWFGDSSGPHQHFNQVRYRAIEEGLPIVRAAASGYSGFVDPWGRVIKTLPLTNSGAIDSPLPASIH